jgi:hypothetical protein
MTSELVKQLCREGAPIVGMNISGDLGIEDGGLWDEKVILENCNIDNFSCIMISFSKPVTLKNCYLKNATFMFSYFTGGLIIENCVFEQYLDFQSGGHNEGGNAIIIKENLFKGFVNFWDCWFTDQVLIHNNVFKHGTNLLSKDQYVSFDIPPIVENNSGDLAIESELREE